MRTVCFLVLAILSSAVYAQSKEWYGRVVDAQTGAPIAEANLSIPEKGVFFPANSQGEFLVIDAAVRKTDSISFSCIGYQTKKLRASDLTPDIVIKLSPLVKVLKEVKIGIVQFGSKAKREELWTAYNPMHEEALYMQDTHHVTGTIQSVGFFLSNAVDGDVTAPFRVRIYEASPDTMPAKELTKDIIVVTAYKTNTWFDVDLSAYDVTVPKNGFFVAFCLFDGKNYRMSTQPGIGTNVVTPRLGMTQYEFNRHLSYHWQNRNKTWYWEREPFTNNYMIRATVVQD